MINGQRAQVAQAAGECHLELSTNATAIPQSGGTGSVDVRASSPLCTWTAVSTVDWISVNSNANGKGSATVTFTVAPTTGPPRAGTITIAGQHFSVTQSEGCTYTVTPTSYSLDASGGTRAVAITSGAGCPWTGSSNTDWITVTPASGSGPGSLTVTIAATSGPSRTGTATIAGQVLTITQSPGCAFDVAPLSLNVDPAGGTRTINVTAGNGCAWSASSNQPWISIGSPNGSGSGTVAITIAADSGPSRSGTVTVAGQTVTINQGNGCTFALSSASTSAPAAGASGSFDVRAGDGCAWAANTNASWLAVTSGTSGSGNGTVRYTVAANSGPQRTGTITAGGQTFTVTQGAGCSYSISPTTQNVASGGGTLAVAVTTPSGCSWTASSNAGWIGISSGSSGSGNGTVQLVVAPNPDAERRGTATIAGQTYSIVQASGCTFSIAPTSQGMPASGGSASFTVNANLSCAWTAAPNAAWISLTSGTSGNGPGTVQFAAAPNSGAARSGTITAAGQTFTLTQDSGCTAAVTPDTIPVPAPGGSQTVTITTGADCTWSAASNAPWIGIAQPASGSGNGTVRLDIQPNSDAARSGTATVAGKTVTVNQDSGCTITIAPTAMPMAVGGGTGSVTVTAGAGCSWTAVSGAAWIIVTSAPGGTGPGNVTFTVTDNTNPTATPRSGSMTIGNQVFTVNQAGQ